MPLYMIERNFPEPVEEGSNEELLAEAGDEWANGCEQEDDISFAVLKYRPEI